MYRAWWMIRLLAASLGFTLNSERGSFKRAQAAVMEDMRRGDNAVRMVGIYDSKRKGREVTEQECGLLCEQKGEERIKKK